MSPSRSPATLRFPFGLPITARDDLPERRYRVFVLGAYESAFHIRWYPPPGFTTGLSAPGFYINAIPVAPEPRPFWNGDDEDRHFAAWRDAIGFRPEWGRVAPATGSNGPSGQWVEERVFEAFKVDGEKFTDWWTTDCLDSYFKSNGDLERRLAANYRPFADHFDGVARDSLPDHPEEDDVVDQSIPDHVGRLRAQLSAARPELIITLGNAALRVLRHILDVRPGREPSALLVADPAIYGVARNVTVESRTVEWLPLAHPRSGQGAYRSVHDAWFKRRQAA